ncbi:MAG: TatD family hydrolase [Sandaracinaceae bacterium]|nr:TatD family hydrolase [Sandaracinaceae bacterium]
MSSTRSPALPSWCASTWTSASCWPSAARSPGRTTEGPRVGRSTPDEWLLVETDAPSGRLASGPERNEPAALAQVVETLAQLRGQSVEHVAALTYANARRLFQLPP